MSKTNNRSKHKVCITAFLLAITAMFAGISTAAEAKKSYIVSASNFNLLKSSVKALGVKPTHELSIIDSLAVELSDSQIKSLKKKLPISISTNHKVELNALGWGQRRWQPKSVINEQIDATYLHMFDNYGEGVTIGFLDTGLDQLPGLSLDLQGNDKAWGTYDAINDTVSNYDDEESGHGTHVASIATNSDYDVKGRIYGVAPNAAHVGIKAFDGEGKATYADVIRGIDWALRIKDQINLRVLNMSFSGPVRSHYWEDPLNKAVMKAWQAGIVVVASAGNKGPEPMTIGVPGNVPYIITVGAMTDNYTPFSYADDKIADFSAAGPTPEGFVKPDLVAPGGHISGLMSLDSKIVMEHPEFHDGGRYFEMSGTSQAAAVVSGVVALMLTDNPSLTPDQVKCRLVDGAYRARNADGSIRYSVFQQGAGMVSALYSVLSNASNCANTNLNIAKDLADEVHYTGPANIDDSGNFYVEGLGQEYVWDFSNGQLDGNSMIWNVLLNDPSLAFKNQTTTDGLLWKNDFETNGLLWKNSLGADGLLWKNSLSEGETATIAINNWVEQE